jgi:hypothetical protein
MLHPSRKRIEPHPILVACSRHAAGGGGVPVDPAARGVAQEHLVQYAAKAVDVAAFVDLLGARRLFRTHVPHRAERHPGPGQTLTTRCTHSTRDAEVRDDRLASGKQHVLRLDVAVDDTIGVGVAERTRDLLGNPDRLVERESSFFRQPDPERWPVDEWHDVVQQPADVAGII